MVREAVAAIMEKADDSYAPVAVADGSGRALRSLLGVIRWSSHVLSGRFTTHLSCLIPLRHRSVQPRVCG